MNEQVLPPNFDDERTVQSARPVVPLNEIDARVRRRRHWFLGGAFAVAMMLGAASALVASYFRLRNVPTFTTSEAAELDVAPPPQATVENAPAESSVSDVADQPAEALLEAPKKEPVVKRRAVVKHEPEPIEPRDEPKMSEDYPLHRIRDAVLLDEWQERRARRVFRRERGLDRYHHRDLSNIDEIFEGRRRP